LQRSKKF